MSTTPCILVVRARVCVFIGRNKLSLITNPNSPLIGRSIRFVLDFHVIMGYIYIYIYILIWKLFYLLLNFYFYVFLLFTPHAQPLARFQLIDPYWIRFALPLIASLGLGSPLFGLYHPRQPFWQHLSGGNHTSYMTIETTRRTKNV